MFTFSKIKEFVHGNPIYVVLNEEGAVTNDYLTYVIQYATIIHKE